MDADNDTPSTPDEQRQWPPQELLVKTFHDKGYLTLSPLLSHAFTSRLLHECSSAFHAVLQYLRRCHEIDFDAPSRRNVTGEGFEYPLGVGVKNGYKELVMRSPGRYELALLADADDDDEGGGRGQGKRKQVLSKELLFGTCSSLNDGSTSATLELLLDWINEGSTSVCSEYNQQDDAMQQQQQQQQQQLSAPQNEETFSQDHLQIQKLLDLINAIFSETPTHPQNENNTNTANTTTKGYKLIHFSLLLSTPGSQMQSWHADGGHIHLPSHAPTHCLNVFLPLVDLCPALGPTELRPKSHYYTRDLTRMALGAMARKEWEASAVPVLRGGEALVFDYRILHRGRANRSHLEDGGDEDKRRDGEGCGEKETSGKTRDGKEGGRDRPILVMTFAKSWFVDVCNFPKRSIFSLRPKLAVIEN